MKNMGHEEEKYIKHIVINPRILVGKPIIKGTWIPVALLVRLVGLGMSFEEILADYPHLTKEDILAACLYAAAVLRNEEIFPHVEGKLQ